MCYTKGHVGLLYPKDSVILTYTRNDDELELKEIEDKQISKNTHSIHLVLERLRCGSCQESMDVQQLTIQRFYECDHSICKKCFNQLVKF